MHELAKAVFSSQNQFASGGLLLMIVGAVGVYLRSLPQKIWGYFLSQATLSLTVNDDDDAFIWVKEWFLEQQFVQRVRSLDLDTTLHGESVGLIPAPGRHWFWFSARPFFVYYQRNEPIGASGRRTEIFTFVTFGRNQTLVRRFVGEIVECHKKKIKVMPCLYAHREHCWRRVVSYMPRRLDSVILDSAEKERLLADVGRFQVSRERYARLGVPYHRGYLLYGPPGTGKTSLASALAAYFGLSIYVVNLNDFNDRTLVIAVDSVAANAVLLFEDIDCMKSGKSRAQSGGWSNQPTKEDSKEDVADRLGVTLSGLLNVLDGFHAPDQVLFVMTTNHIESLDDALLRPGRIDYKLYLGKASDRQKVELYLRFFPSASEFEAAEFVDANTSAETMAEFQGRLLELEQNQGSLDLPELESVESRFLGR